MAWVKLDDEFASNPKLMEAGPLGMAMQVAALCYCNRLLTDGRLSRPAAATLLSFEGLAMRMWSGEVAGGGEDAEWQFVADDLVAAGVWHEPGHDCPDCPPISSGYYLHDYLHFQPSRAQVEAERATKQEAGRKGGRATAQARAQATATAPATAGAQANGVAESKPDPVPDPVPLEEPPPTPPAALALVPVTVSSLTTTAPRQQVFDAWLEATGKNPLRTQFDDKRRKRIDWALKNYPLPDVLDAVSGWQNSPHHRGENNCSTVYNDLTLLLRDAEHLERFRDLERYGERVQRARPKGLAAAERLKQRGAG